MTAGLFSRQRATAAGRDGKQPERNFVKWHNRLAARAAKREKSAPFSRREGPSP